MSRHKVTTIVALIFILFGCEKQPEKEIVQQEVVFGISHFGDQTLKTD